MHLPSPTQQEITEFQELYLEEFGVELTIEQALELGSNLMQFVYLKDYEPIHPLRS